MARHQIECDIKITMHLAVKEHYKNTRYGLTFEPDCNMRFSKTVRLNSTEFSRTILFLCHLEAHWFVSFYLHVLPLQVCLPFLLARLFACLLGNLLTCSIACLLTYLLA